MTETSIEDLRREATENGVRITINNRIKQIDYQLIAINQKITSQNSSIKRMSKTSLKWSQANQVLEDLKKRKEKLEAERKGLETRLNNY